MPAPSFLCIGAQKAATSWLYKNLLEHPDVWMPPLKELHYFDYLYIPENRPDIEYARRKAIKRVIRQHRTKQENIDIKYLQYLRDLGLVNAYSEEWYQIAFDWHRANNKVTGEITPSYCTIPREGIEYVYQTLGLIKLIYIIRNPVDRAIAQIRMRAQRRLRKTSKPTVRQWFKLADETPFKNRGDYKSYIPNWVDVFGVDQILFIPFKQIRDEPRRVADLVEEHLGISNYKGYSTLKKPVHVSRKSPFPEDLKSKLRSELKDQQIFLEDYFGQEFCSMI